MSRFFIGESESESSSSSESEDDMQNTKAALSKFATTYESSSGKFLNLIFDLIYDIAL